MFSHGAQKKSLKYFEERAAQNVAVKTTAHLVLYIAKVLRLFLSSHELKIAFNPLTPGSD